MTSSKSTCLKRRAACASASARRQSTSRWNLAMTSAGRRMSQSPTLQSRRSTSSCDDRERGEIVELRRVAEPADLHDVRSLLEAADVAIGVHELFLRRVNAHGTGDARPRLTPWPAARASRFFRVRAPRALPLKISDRERAAVADRPGDRRGACGVRQHRARTAERDDEETEALCRLTSYRSRRVRRSARPCRTSP